MLLISIFFSGIFYILIVLSIASFTLFKYAALIFESIRGTVEKIKSALFLLGILDED